MTPQEARAQRLVAAVNRRRDEAACAWDFLRWGDSRGEHAKRCIFGEKHACSREYDPRPGPEATPVDKRMYEDTGIGALYGWGTTSLWQTAGWNVKHRSRRGGRKVKT